MPATEPLQLDASIWKPQFTLAEGVTYLNAGSFGPSPRSVQDACREWSAKLESQPMQFFVRDMEPALDDACRKLGEFVGSPAKDLVFVDNATFGMNVVAASVELHSDDEVLLTDHEYGAVVRIWQRAGRRVGAKVVTASTPPVDSIGSPAEFVDALFAAVTDRTRLIVVSHVTSPTAIVLPVAEICREARRREIPVCIDGPHAVAMLPVNLREIDCDYYAASCHKWLSGPFGSGFLYVSPRQQGTVRPAVVSWGGSVAGRQPSWKDEFQWIGTRDPASFLGVSAAIDFLQKAGLELFRARGHELAREFRSRMQEFTQAPPFVADDPAWFGTMVAAPLPALDGEPPAHGRRDPLQNELQERHGIEIPVVHWQGRRLLRASCHLYNDRSDLDRLMRALETCRSL